MMWYLKVVLYSVISLWDTEMIKVGPKTIQVSHCTVYSEVFARVLFSRGFVHAKFREN